MESSKALHVKVVQTDLNDFNDFNDFNDWTVELQQKGRSK